MIAFHRLALEELRQAQAWYQAKSLKAAERFFRATVQTLDRLQTDPASFATIGRHWHYVRISRFPFVLVYRIRTQDELFVVAVAHTSRRGHYWRSRK